MDKKQDKVDFSWRYQPLKSTPDGILISYVKSNLLIPSREMILQALRAYWLPLAYQEQGCIDQVFLERLFRKAVYALEKHALFLRDQSGLDYPVNYSGELLIGKTSNLLKMQSSTQSVDRLPEPRRNSDANSKLNGMGFTTDDLFESVGGEDFDDSGFS